MEQRTEFFVGLDVHKDSISVAACEEGRTPARFVGVIGPDVRQLAKLLAKAGGPSHVSVVYEAGPTGFGLYRELRRRGYRCEMRENWPASSGLSPARRSSAKPFDWQWPEAMRHGIRREEPSVTLRRKAPGNPRN